MRTYGNAPFPAEGQWTKAPAAVYYRLPMELGTTWITTFTETLSGSATLGVLGTIKVGPTLTPHTITYTVDAYGALTVPGASAQQALRIRKEDRFVNGTTAGIRVSYLILAKNGASVQFMVSDTLATSGTVGVSSVQWTTATPTTVQQISNAPVSFGLAQNYPNPFNPSTMIRFTLPERQAVTLRVYNLLGEEVATLVNQIVNAGESVVEFKATGSFVGDVSVQAAGGVGDADEEDVVGEVKQ